MNQEPFFVRSRRWVLLPVILAAAALCWLGLSAPGAAAMPADAGSGPDGGPGSPLAGSLVYTVTNTNDASVGSLREVIIESNLDTRGFDHFIFFAIPGTGAHTIALLTCLPEVTQPVTIDGYSQAGASPNTLAVGDNAVLRIELDGANANACPSGAGILVTAGGSTVKGLAIHGFLATPGIELKSLGGDVVSGNFLGTNINGTQAMNNGFGVKVTGVSSNTIGGPTAADRNLISGNLLDGVLVASDGVTTPTQNLIEGNYIGTDVSGAAAMGNGVQGVDITGGSDNTIGAPAAVSTTRAALGPALTPFPPGNLISGNLLNGVGLYTGANHNRVAANRIGVAADGVSPLGNTFEGVTIVDSSSNLIGGDLPVTSSVCPGDCNMISYNGGAGVTVDQNTGRAISNTILSNWIQGNAHGGIRFSRVPLLGCADPTGPNNGISWPLLTVTNHYSVAVTINCLPLTTYRVQVFYDHPPCDGQYQYRAGDYDLTTAADGTAFVQFLQVVSEERCYTATVTEFNNGLFGSTSEDIMLRLYLPLLKK
jgi:hypothetical protein